MPNNWINFIPSPKDGDFADAAGLRKAFSAVGDRTEYLRSRLEEFSKKNGRTMVLNSPCSSDVNLGSAVYYNSDSELLEPAIAEGEVGETGVLLATKRAFAIGICVFLDGNSCDVITVGECNFLSDFGIDVNTMLDIVDDIDMSTPQRMYLSPLVPGKLTTKPISPLIQLGVFSDKKSFVIPLQKDIFESHIHHKFEIPMVPAALPVPKADGTTVERVEWTSYIGGVERGLVDYSSGTLDAGTNPSIKTYASIDVESHVVPTYSDISRTKIEIRKSGIQMGISILTGIEPAVDAFSVTGGSTITVPWPAAGEKVLVPGTNFVFSLFRVDSEADMSDEFEEVGSKMTFILPDDLKGWTNASPYDRDTPEDCYLKLLPHSVNSLNAVWPPVPLESVHIETRGVTRSNGKEYIPTNRFIYWKSIVPPWHWDESYLPLDLAELPVGSNQNTVLNRDYSGTLFFGNTSLGNARSVVLSLTSVTPALELVDCFTGKPSRAGHLNIDFHLGLMEDDTLTMEKGALNTYSETLKKFKKTSVVSGIKAGPGISIAGGYAIGEHKHGPIEISSTYLRKKGEISIVSLVNAKEDMINDIIPIVHFPIPSSGTYKMVSCVKLPGLDELGDVDISMSYSASPIGLITGGGILTRAVFELSHYVVKSAGVASLIDYTTNKFSTKTLEFSVPSGYQKMRAIAFPPNVISVSDAGEKLRPGDKVFTVWHRVVKDANNLQDTYNGSFGFFHLEWNITTTPHT